MNVNNRHIPGRLSLLFLLLFIQQIAGFIPGLSFSQVQASDKNRKLHALLFHPEAPFQLNIPIRFLEDAPDEREPVLHAKHNRRRTRFCITAPSQQLNLVPRLPQLQNNLAHYIPEQENKTGIYLQQDAFLPAYYTFLFRYTLF